MSTSNNINRFIGMVQPLSTTAAEQVRLDRDHNDLVDGKKTERGRPNNKFDIWLGHGKQIGNGLLETAVAAVVRPIFAVFLFCCGGFKEAGKMFAVDFLAGTVVSAIATIAAIFRFVIIYPIVAGLNLHTGVETAANAAVYMADCFKPPKEEVTV